MRTIKVSKPRIPVPSNGDVAAPAKMHVNISPPNMQTAVFEIVGTAPLVVHRFSHKLKNELFEKMKAGSTASGGMAKKKERKPANIEELYNDARYISPDGWDGFNVSAIRCGLISACRLVNFKMTLAKMGIFVIADGYDAKEPQYGLIRIYGTPERTEMPARVETGQPYICVRPMYRDWSAKIRIRFDAQMFVLTDIANLLARMGEQVGLCEGRPDSKNSAGMGWGTFRIRNEDEKQTD